MSVKCFALFECLRNVYFYATRTKCSPKVVEKKKKIREEKKTSALLLFRDLNSEVTFSSFSIAVMKGLSKKPGQMW